MYDFPEYTTYKYKGQTYKRIYNYNGVTGITKWFKLDGLIWTFLTGGVIASDQLTGNAVGGNSQNQITGNDILSNMGSKFGLNTNKLIPGWSPGSYAWFDLNARLGIAVDGFLGDSGSWVFNPYKSKHYDALCIAATGFNKRKERQLLCKRLVCIEQMQKSGGPIEACEFDYSLGMCMYVDSARYKLEGSAGLGTIFGSIGRTFFSNILGNGAFYAYWVLCGYTLKKADTLFDASSQICTSPGSFKRVACGITGSLLSLREIVAFAKNPYNPMTSSTTPLDPVKQNGGNDFCNGVNYAE